MKLLLGEEDECNLHVLSIQKKMHVFKTYPHPSQKGGFEEMEACVNSVPSLFLSALALHSWGCGRIQGAQKAGGSEQFCANDGSRADRQLSSALALVGRVTKAACSCFLRSNSSFLKMNDGSRSSQ